MAANKRSARTTTRRLAAWVDDPDAVTPPAPARLRLVVPSSALRGELIAAGVLRPDAGEEHVEPRPGTYRMDAAGHAEARREVLLNASEAQRRWLAVYGAPWLRAAMASGCTTIVPPLFHPSHHPSQP